MTRSQKKSLWRTISRCPFLSNMNNTNWFSCTLSVHFTRHLPITEKSRAQGMFGCFWKNPFICDSDQIFDDLFNAFDETGRTVLVRVFWKRTKGVTTLVRILRFRRHQFILRTCVQGRIIFCVPGFDDVSDSIEL